MKIKALKKYPKILLVGYGVEGKTTEKFLKKYHPTVEIGIADEKDDSNYLNKQSKYDLAIRASGVRKELITIPYTTATNIFFANIGNRKTIGITGSKGKSTTAALVHGILDISGYSSILLGNIGTPMLKYFLGDTNPDDTLVLELSSYQLDDIEYSPNIACILNIYQDHVKYHGTFEKYTEAKGNIVKFSTSHDYFLYNGKFPELLELAHMTVAQKIDFSIRDLSTAPLASLEMTSLISNESIQAARAITSLFDLSDTIFQSAVQKFSGLPHRLQTVGTFRDITFINDSAATTPEATMFALDHIQNIGSLILGGLDRGIDFTQLAQKIAEKKIKTIILFPDAGKKLDQALKATGVDGTVIHHVQTMNEAVNLCHDHTPIGSTCLLSPGCASYNQYANFSERGETFTRYVTRNI